jgi:hypothetical protein
LVAVTTNEPTGLLTLNVREGGVKTRDKSNEEKERVRGDGGGYAT